MTLHGHIHEGQIVLDYSGPLPEGAAVSVQIVNPSTNVHTGDSPSLLERLGDVVGAIDDLPADGAKNLDHYLYGVPKQ